MGAATARAREAKMAEEEVPWAVRSLPGPPPPDWARLPNEVLALILSWLPPEMLATRCRLACRRWRDLVDGPAAWQLQWRREPSMRAALEAVGRFPRLDWRRLGVLRPLGRNLVRNPCGTGRQPGRPVARRRRQKEVAPAASRAPLPSLLGFWGASLCVRVATSGSVGAPQAPSLWRLPQHVLRKPGS